ncbi:MAG: outer membrane beta-barrel protein [Rubrivivax sp.]
MNPRSTPDAVRRSLALAARRTTARLCLLAGAALAASAAQAADTYVGLGLGDARVGLPCSANQPCDRAASGSYKVFMGVEPTQHLGVELMAWRLGDARGSGQLGTNVLPARTSSEGLGLVGVARTRIDAWTLRARLGVALGTKSRTELDTSSIGPVAPGSTTLRERTAVWGLGASYALNKSWALQADWDRLPARVTTATKAKADLYTVGVSYRF